ncbi:MAG TPA: hypothetical protein VI894_01235 [Candidatus Nanoarchaeia archaeon]|nr:hypothetical protein [Candidatus Nanoarchaeia archaeon]
MNKRGQATAFMVIGLVLLFSLLIFNYANQLGIKKPVYSTSDSSEVKNAVDACLNSVGAMALNEMSQNGDINFDFPPIIFDFYSDNKKKLPSREELSIHLSAFVDESLAFCVNDSIGSRYNVVLGAPSTNVIFGADEIVMATNFPVKVIFPEQVVELQSFIATYPVKFLKIYNITELIINKTVDNPEWIDAEFLLDIDEEINLYPLDSETLLYEIIDADSSLGGETFSYRFIVRPYRVGQ